MNKAVAALEMEPASNEMSGKSKNDKERPPADMNAEEA